MSAFWQKIVPAALAVIIQKSGNAWDALGQEAERVRGTLIRWLIAYAIIPLGLIFSFIFSSGWTFFVAVVLSIAYSVSLIFVNHPMLVFLGLFIPREDGGTETWLRRIVAKTIFWEIGLWLIFYLLRGWNHPVLSTIAFCSFGALWAYNLSTGEDLSWTEKLLASVTGKVLLVTLVVMALLVILPLNIIKDEMASLFEAYMANPQLMTNIVDWQFPAGINPIRIFGGLIGVGMIFFAIAIFMGWLKGLIPIGSRAKATAQVGTGQPNQTATTAEDSQSTFTVNGFWLVLPSLLFLVCGVGGLWGYQHFNPKHLTCAGTPAVQATTQPGGAVQITCSDPTQWTPAGFDLQSGDIVEVQCSLDSVWLAIGQHTFPMPVGEVCEVPAGYKGDAYFQTDEPATLSVMVTKKI